MSEKAKPAGASGGFEQIMLISGWRPHEKNTLRAYLDLSLSPCGLAILGCSYHQRADGRRWVGLPGRRIQGGDGYEQIIDFASPQARERFQKAALEAISQHLEARGPR